MADIVWANLASPVPMALLDQHMVQKDGLAQPGSAAVVGYQPAGTGAVATNVAAAFVRGEKSIWDFMTTQQIDDALAGITANDLTASRDACYEYCGTNGYNMNLEVGKIRFTTNWDLTHKVNIVPRNGEKCIIVKDGNITGIRTTGASSQCFFGPFTLDAINDIAGDGILTVQFTGIFENVLVIHQGGDAWRLSPNVVSGFNSQFRKCLATDNVGNGWILEGNFYEGNFISCYAARNQKWGVDILINNAFNQGYFDVEQNTLGGFRDAGQGNNFSIHGESQTSGIDIHQTSTCISPSGRKTYAAYPYGFRNDTATNVSQDDSQRPGYDAPRFGQVIRGTNDVGFDVIYSSGTAGDGGLGGAAIAKHGGNATWSTGDANGAIGNESAGEINVLTGSSVGTAPQAAITLAQNSGGVVIVGASSAIRNLNGAALQVNDGVTFKATPVLSADPNTLDNYAEGGSGVTVTLSGVTASVTGTAFYTIVGNVVTLDLPALSGTSNATGKTYTGLPSAIKPTTQKVFSCATKDNGGSYAAAIGLVRTDGVIEFFASVGSAPFTNSGACSIQSVSVSYTLK